MHTHSSRFVDFMIFILVAIYAGSYFMPDHFGVKCTEDAAPFGPAFLGVYYMIWTCYTVRVIQNDPMINLVSQSKTAMWARFKELCFSEYEGEYDHKMMVLAQREMFMITTIINMIIQIILIGYQMLSFVLVFGFDDAVVNECKDPWHFQDSAVSMTLNCFMISMPI